MAIQTPVLGCTCPVPTGGLSPTGTWRPEPLGSHTARSLAHISQQVYLPLLLSRGHRRRHRRKTCSCVTPRPPHACLCLPGPDQSTHSCAPALGLQPLCSSSAVGPVGACPFLKGSPTAFLASATLLPSDRAQSSSPFQGHRHHGSHHRGLCAVGCSHGALPAEGTSRHSGARCVGWWLLGKELSAEQTFNNRPEGPFAPDLAECSLRTVGRLLPQQLEK